jgi:hypothetical protein
MPSPSFTPAQDAFLDDLSRRAFLYFWETAHPATGLVPDRARADGSAPGRIASTASTGFGLAALAIGAARGWITESQAHERAELTLNTCLKLLEVKRGFLYHFIDLADLKRAWNCELSSIDTALLLLGAMTFRGAFPKSRAADLALRLYNRADWPWLATKQLQIRHGWFPESGFIPYNWDAYSEGMGMYLLALGAPTKPLPPAAWAAWQRRNWTEYDGRRFLHHPPLFIHQFSHAFVDFRGLRDTVAGSLDYWRNSVDATLAQRQFCVDLAGRFPGCYGENLWGLTSSDSRAGYVDWGGPPMPGREPDARIDGSVVPCAPAGSLPFCPQECVEALMHMHAEYGSFAYGPYGFADAFHPTLRWANEDVIGIDQGVTLLMAENARTARVWKWFGANAEIRRAIKLAGLRPDGLA